MKGPGGGCAIMNGRVVRVGGVVNGATVIEIASLAVEMESEEGKRFLVRLGARSAAAPEAPADEEQQSPSEDGEHPPDDESDDAGESDPGTQDGESL